MKSWAGNLMLLQPSLSPITWETHKTGRRMDTAAISWEGTERSVQNAGMWVKPASVGFIMWEALVKLGLALWRGFSFFDILFYFESFNRLLWESTGLDGVFFQLVPY